MGEFPPRARVVFMLIHIDIQNFVLVDKLSLDFRKGLNVLTGETGAGKSIWVDAIALALGERADSKVIRQGESRCDISVGFDLRHIDKAQQWLQEHQLDNPENVECIVRRVIQLDGPSRSTINGIPCPLHLVREFGDLVLTIHGQNQQMDLLRTDGQQQQLDNFGKHQALLQKIQRIYQEWQHNLEEVSRLQSLLNHRQNELDLLRFQVHELKQLNLKADEWHTLNESHKQFHHAYQWRQQLQHALLLITDDDTHAALNQIYRAMHLLQAIKSDQEPLLGIQRLINEAAINLEESGNQLRQYCDHLTSDPHKLAEIEQRMDSIHQLSRKHRCTPDALFQVLQNLIARINVLENAEGELKKLELHQATLLKAYRVEAAELSAMREKAARYLSTHVSEWMQQLGMPGGQLKVNLEKIPEEEVHALGQERIRFLVSMNPGQELHALQKTASGGELSRIHLALQVITAQSEQTPTLIFDEVDVGIGGQTAAIVGKLLRHLGEKTQVLCITHLPQVAAYGHHHYKVSKIIQPDRTRSTIEPLDNDSRTKELARMLGGENITAQTLSHASEMLQI